MGTVTNDVILVVLARRSASCTLVSVSPFVADVRAAVREGPIPKRFSANDAEMPFCIGVVGFDSVIRARCSVRCVAGKPVASVRRASAVRDR